MEAMQKQLEENHWKIYCGLILRGASRRFLELARQGAFDFAVSDVILDEMVDVLQRRFAMPLAEAVENKG